MKIILLRSLIVSFLVSIVSCTKEMESGSTVAEINAQQLLLAIQSRRLETDFAEIFSLAGHANGEDQYYFITHGFFVIGRNSIAVEDFDTGNTTAFDLTGMREFSFNGDDQNILSIYLE